MFNNGVFNGNVGIGTSTPAYKLDVNGDIRAQGNIAASKFYDRDNGAYYVDSNGTSVMNQVNLNMLCIRGDCKTAWPIAAT